MFSIYIHIPFCLSKCGYCDFHSIAMPLASVPGAEYADAVCLEIERQMKRHNLAGRRVDTIYFGGGTPSILGASNIQKILDAIYRHFSVTEGAEITIEANPETLKHENVKTLKKLCNRLSIGIQSFDDCFLKKLGRIHNADTARRAVVAARDAGFKNINIDLMWGLPGQGIKDLELDLEKAIELEPQHMSAYQLTNHFPSSLTRPLPNSEPSSPLGGGGWGEGEFSVGEELSYEMFLLIHNKLTVASYEHYEISNFAKKPSSNLRTSFRCHHNENYWHYGEWLGFGSGATSFLRGSTPAYLRLISIKDISKYLICDFSYETEEFDQKTAMAEYCFLGLRMFDGIDLIAFERRFGRNFETIYPHLIEKWAAAGHAECHSNRFFLTLEGMLISDTLFHAFV